MLELGRAALAVCAYVCFASAARPAEQQNLRLVPQGSADDTLDWSVLPKYCGPDGVIKLEASTAYRTDVGSHVIEETCQVLQGAPGARIFLRAGITFKSMEVEVKGPLALTMAEGVQSISSAALRSPGHLRVVSPEGSNMEFTDLKFTGASAVLSAQHFILLEGQGSIKIENVALDKDSAVDSEGLVNITADSIVFRNCTAKASAGAAVHGMSGTYLGSNGTIVFEDCHTDVRGGALASQRSVTIAGKGSYVFKRCSSTSNNLGGGAVSSLANTELDLLPEGSVVFKQCSALGEEEGGSGGGIYSGGDICIRGGAVKFDACHARAGDGDAMSAPRGTVRISGMAQVKLANNRGGGSSIFGRNVELPIDGSLEAKDVFETEDLLAEKPSTLSDNACPTGSRFRLADDTGIPVRGKCCYCASGTASLAPSQMGFSRKVVPAAGLRIVLVRRGSPNAIRDFAALVGNRSRANDSHSLGVALGAYFGGFRTTTLVLATVNKTVFEQKGREFQARDGLIRLCLPTIAAVFPGMTVGWCRGHRYRRRKEWFIRNRGKDGTVSPWASPAFVLGVAHDVLYTYEPHNPYEACVPCHLLAAESADKLTCPGGARVASLPGHMLMHAVGNRTVDVHRCPNAAACPGSILRLTAEGQLSSRSSICANGYKRSPGCVQCAAGYGRPQLDAFTCQSCGTASLARQVGIALLSNGVFYALALNAAKPRTETQQIFKVFLAFLTISCRSLSAVLHTEHYGRLKPLVVSTRCLVAVSKR